MMQMREREGTYRVLVRVTLSTNEVLVLLLVMVNVVVRQVVFTAVVFLSNSISN